MTRKNDVTVFYFLSFLCGAETMPGRSSCFDFAPEMSGKGILVTSRRGQMSSYHLTVGSNHRKPGSGTPAPILTAWTFLCFEFFGLFGIAFCFGFIVQQIVHTWFVTKIWNKVSEEVKQSTAVNVTPMGNGVGITNKLQPRTKLIV